MFRCPQQIIIQKNDYMEKRKGKFYPKYKCMLNQQHTAPLGMFFFYCESIQSCSWLWSCSRLPRENIHIQATALPSPWWRKCAKARLNVLLKKSPLPVNNICDPPIHHSCAPLTAVAVSIAQLYMTAFANFHGFSVAFIMDRHLLRSVASTVRKSTTQHVQRKNKRPIKLTAKWGGSFMNFWKCKQAESFVGQITITGWQIMKEGGWVQMSEKWSGRVEGGGLKNYEIETEIVFNCEGRPCFT